MRSRRKVLAIINPAAGGGRALERWKALRQRLGLGFDEEFISQSAANARAKAAEGSGAHQILVIAGGDGTLQAAVTGLLEDGDPSTPIVVVPLGTGNDIARSLGVPGAEAALSEIGKSQAKSIDTIKLKCRSHGGQRTIRALSLASVGITGELLKRTTPRVKRLFGPRLAYYDGLIRALWQTCPSPISVAWDSQTLKREFLLVGASNGEFAGGGMRLAPGARLDDGEMTITLIERMGRLEACMQLRKLARGRHTGHPKVRSFTTSTLSVSTEIGLDVAADGELVGKTPATFQVRPGSLRVLSPEQ